MITVETFSKCFPHAKDPQEWVAALNHFLPLYDIQDEAAFLAQWGHETQGFTRLVENLNYSATGLLQTWPTRFTPATAQEYANKPERIANKVYALRLGNGEEESGDGWKYRGRGAQITGKANYLALAKAIGKSLEETIEYLETIQGCIESACWYWQSRGLNRFASSIELLTKRVNGGLIGIKERRELFAKIDRVIG